MIDIVRGLVRPVVTLLFAVGTLGLAIYATAKTGDVPTWFISLAGLPIAFWFGARKPQI